MEVNKSTLIKIIFIIIFFISTFTAEFFYRDPLFNNSVKIAEKLQDKLSSLINFFDFYTYLGKIDYILITLVLLFFPVSYCLCFLFNCNTNLAFSSLFKNDIWKWTSCLYRH